MSNNVNEKGITPDELSRLEEAATKAKDTAYCPYSSFRVGCALLTAPAADGSNNKSTIITGANVENASYPVGTCAERCALAKGVTEGFLKYKAIAVATDVTPAASPCGMCRQFMREFCEVDMPIVMLDKDGAKVVSTLEQLLPMSFGPEHLLLRSDLGRETGEKKE